MGGGESAAAAGEEPNTSGSISNVELFDKIIARSRMFSNSRILPGQRYAFSWYIEESDIASMRFPILAENLLTRNFESNFTSPSRSRSGGNETGKTFSR